MTMILIGFLFLLFQCNLSIGDAVIGLLPSFVGYFLILAGLDELIVENKQLALLRPWVIGMGLFTGVQYAAALFGFTTTTPLLDVMIALVESALCYWIIHRIIAGIAEIEYRLGVTLMAERLKTWWIWMVFLMTCIYVFLFLGPALSLVLAIGYFVIAILFLVAFHKTSLLFRARPR